jgi:hypothetical protein
MNEHEAGSGAEREPELVLRRATPLERLLALLALIALLASAAVGSWQILAGPATTTTAVEAVPAGGDDVQLP